MAQESLTRLITDIKLTDIFLTIFTLALAVYTYRLWKSTDSLWRESLSQRESQERNSKIQLRAYVDIDLHNFTLTPVSNNRPVLSASATLRNSGQSPAYKLILSFHYRFMKWPLTEMTEIEWPNVDVNFEGVGFLGPSQSKNVSGAHGVSFPVDNIQRYELKLYVIGIAKYVDIFGEHHETRICGAIVQTWEWLSNFERFARGEIPKADMNINFEGARFGNSAT